MVKHGGGEHGSDGMGMYLRFGAMILTAMVVMYWTMFVSSWELSHVRFSQSRMSTALTMGGTMGLDAEHVQERQGQPGRRGGQHPAARGRYHPGPKPDHGRRRGVHAGHDPPSLDGITRSERFEVDDVRVCELAVEISEA
jgi:hypothetical protein